MKKRSTAFLGRVLSLLLSEKRQTVAGSVYVYVHTRARVGSVLSLSVFSYPKKLFFLFHSFFIYFFLLFLFSVKVNSFLAFSFLKKASTSNILIVITQSKCF